MKKLSPHPLALGMEMTGWVEETDGCLEDLSHFIQFIVKSWSYS